METVSVLYSCLGSPRLAGLMNGVEAVKQGRWVWPQNHREPNPRPSASTHQSRVLLQQRLLSRTGPSFYNCLNPCFCSSIFSLLARPKLLPPLCLSSLGHGFPQRL